MREKEEIHDRAKAIGCRPGERYVDFFDRLNRVASRAYATDDEYRKS